jgi:hypothetical protein
MAVRLQLATMVLLTATVTSEPFLAPPVRVVTGDGALALELGASTGAITALELDGRVRSPPLLEQGGGGTDGGGVAISEYLGAFGPCGASTVPPKNMSVLANGDFAKRSPDGAAAAGWAASSVAGFTCTGYRRVTGANVTRAGHTAAVQASTTKLHELAGASRTV